MSEDTFRLELEALVNKHSKENGSDTPDFILAEMITNTLEVFDACIKARDRFYNHFGRKDLDETV